MVMAEEELYTVAEVARRLKVTPYTVRSWINTGRIRGIQLGSRKAGWRVRASDLERFLSDSEAPEAEGR